MTDKELIELAAKAAGMKVNLEQQLERESLGFGHVGLWIVNGSTRWNPLTDDGDALRLAATLELEVSFGQRGAIISMMRGNSIEEISEDYMTATRRAITRAAAQIGKEME